MKIGEAIFHITHVQNLAKILDDGCLWCDIERKIRNLETKGIAYQAIKLRREQRVVPVPEYGVVADYVPFYFAPRSPMLYRIQKGEIEGYDEGQEPIIHLVAKIEEVAEADLSFCFTNGHAEMLPTEFYESLDDLDKIDWDLMKSNFWFDRKDDMNRKWRRQAEFLVHNHFPIKLIRGIGVCSKATKNEVEDILIKSGKCLKTIVIPDWYY